MARNSAKMTRATTVANPKRSVLERCGSRWCAGYEVTVKVDPNQINILGRIAKARGTGERE
jgi:hypothetical protein